MQLVICWSGSLRESRPSAASTTVGTSSVLADKRNGYRITGTCTEASLLHWTLLVTATETSVLFLLQLPSYPLMLLRLALLRRTSAATSYLHVSARRFGDPSGRLLGEMTLPSAVVASASMVSTLLAVPSVAGRPLHLGAEVRILLGHVDGGVSGRVVTVEEIYRGLFGERSRRIRINDLSSPVSLVHERSSGGWAFFHLLKRPNYSPYNT